MHVEVDANRHLPVEHGPNIGARWKKRRFLSQEIIWQLGSILDSILSRYHSWLRTTTAVCWSYK